MNRSTLSDRVIKHTEGAHRLFDRDGRGSYQRYRGFTALVDTGIAGDSVPSEPADAGNDLGAIPRTD